MIASLFKLLGGREEKVRRLEHANQLISSISRHGWRPFFNRYSGRVAAIDMDDGGHLWWIDDGLGRRISMRKPLFSSNWGPEGFSHGGSLKSLAGDMRDYVLKGTRIPAWKVLQACWGLDRASAYRLAREVSRNPIIDSGSSKNHFYSEA